MPRQDKDAHDRMGHKKFPWGTRGSCTSFGPAIIADRNAASPRHRANVVHPIVQTPGCQLLTFPYNSERNGHGKKEVTLRHLTDWYILWYHYDDDNFQILQGALSQTTPDEVCESTTSIPNYTLICIAMAGCGS
jgi:hypothetical protein